MIFLSVSSQHLLKSFKLWWNSALKKKYVHHAFAVMFLNICLTLDKKKNFFFILFFWKYNGFMFRFMIYFYLGIMWGEKYRSKFIFLHMNIQFGHLMWRANSLEKTLMLGKIEGKVEQGMKEDKMVEWCHWLNRHEFEKTLGDTEGQGRLACCSPWGHKESDTT